MMNSLFLSSSSPLYERAGRIMRLEPMSYPHFCDALNFEPMDIESFEKFSLIGGVPKYWMYIKPEWGILKIADELYFKKGAHLESEPDRLLKDEEINGLQARAILEAIGRGARVPSEIASRLGIKQTGLPKPIKILMQTSLVERSQPFSDSERNSKRTLYSITDNSLDFWYGTFSPHRSRWHLYKEDIKCKLIHDHAAKILEREYRALYPDAKRYWDGKNNEFDCVRYADSSGKNVIVTEIKHRILNEKERERLEYKLSESFKRSGLGKKFALKKVEIMDVFDVLKKMSYR